MPEDPAPPTQPAPSTAPQPAGDTTMLLEEATRGDRRAVDELFGLVYDQLRRAAQEQMALESPSHTLSATALVHEAYLRLVGPREVPWQGRGHFYAAAAEAMRRILVDHARGKGRVKRGGGRARTDMPDLAGLAASGSDEIVRFDESFRRLEEESPDAAAVVRLRFFAGLSVEQTAEALGWSASTVDRRWAYARAWLYRQLHEGE